MNLDPNRAAQVAVTLTGTNATRATGRVLTAPAMNATNGFDNPAAVVPVAFTAFRFQGSRVTLDLPAKSVVVIELQ